jgi:hypothetical protein
MFKPLTATPFHTLSRTTKPHVPEWVAKRQVVRAGNRTVYLIDTQNLSEAMRDLNRLRGSGWDVHIDSLRNNSARVSLSQDSFARAA